MRGVPRRSGIRMRLAICVTASLLVTAGLPQSAISSSTSFSPGSLRDLVNGLVLALLLAGLLLTHRKPRARLWIALAVTVLSLSTYSNFGSFRSSRFGEPQFVHYLEQMHYHLGSKYFP
jgi:hypothetical protein